MIRYVETIQIRIESSNIYLKKFLKRLLEIRIVGNLSGLPVKVKEVSSGNIFNFLKWVCIFSDTTFNLMSHGILNEIEDPPWNR